MKANKFILKRVYLERNELRFLKKSKVNILIFDFEGKSTLTKNDWKQSIIWTLEKI